MFLAAYAKNEASDLSRDAIKAMREIAKDFKLEIGDRHGEARPRRSISYAVAVMAAALIDRLMHHCHVVNIRGNSYRMRDHSDLWQAIQPGYEEAKEDQTH